MCSIDGCSVSREAYFSQRNSLKDGDNAKVTDVLWQADPATVAYVLEQLKSEGNKDDYQSLKATVC